MLSSNTARGTRNHADEHSIRKDDLEGHIIAFSVVDKYEIDTKYGDDLEVVADLLVLTTDGAKGDPNFTCRGALAKAMSREQRKNRGATIITRVHRLTSDAGREYLGLRDDLTDDEYAAAEQALRAVLKGGSFDPGPTAPHEDTATDNPWPDRESPTPGRTADPWVDVPPPTTEPTDEPPF